MAHECLMDILVDLEQDIIVSFTDVEQYASLMLTLMFCRQTDIIVGHGVHSKSHIMPGIVCSCIICYKSLKD